jgi:hypothetical protein
MKIEYFTCIHTQTDKMILAPSRLRIGSAQQFWDYLSIQTSSFVKLDRWKKGDKYPWLRGMENQIHGILVSSKEVTEAFQEAYSEVQYKSNREVWIIRPYSKEEACGCQPKLRIRCEEHGGPYSDLRRAAAFFTNQDLLDDFNYKIGLNDMNEAIIKTNHPDLCLISQMSFGLTMMHPPGYDKWYKQSCRKIAEDPENRLDPLPDLPETWELSWGSLVHEWRPDSDYNYWYIASEIASRFQHVGIRLDIKPANPLGRPRPDERLPYTIWCLKGDRPGFLEWLDKVKAETDSDKWQHLKSYVPNERPNIFH